MDLDKINRKNRLSCWIVLHWDLQGWNVNSGTKGFDLKIYVKRCIWELCHPKDVRDRSNCLDRTATNDNTSTSKLSCNWLVRMSSSLKSFWDDETILLKLNCTATQEPLIKVDDWQQWESRHLKMHTENGERLNWIFDLVVLE